MNPARADRCSFEWVAAILLVAAISVPPAMAEVVTPQKPNILLLVAEDLSLRVGAFGDSVASTPNLDRLAAEGVRFPNTFTTAGVCAPSRAALMTGVHQNTLGAGHMRTSSYGRGRDLEPSSYLAVPPAEVKAFPELLRAAGYATLTDFKLDYQFSGTGGGGPFTIWDRSGWVDPVEERPVGAPWFVMRNFMTTHESRLFPVRFPSSLMHAFLLVSSLGSWYPEPVVEPEAVHVAPYYPDTPTVRSTIARQYANTAAMDAEVGAILDSLEAAGESDSTIVIWTTDHGDGLPRAKRELYDSGIRVPLIIRWPEALRPARFEPGTVHEELVSFVDLAPTILAMAGASVPDWVHGRPFAEREPPEPRRYVFAARDRMDETPDRGRAVRDARYKYIRNFETERPAGYVLSFREHLDMMREMRALHAAGDLDPSQSLWFETPRPAEELFDLASDPDEVKNLAQDPDLAEVRTRLNSALSAWERRHADLGAIPEEELIRRGWPDLEQPTTTPPTIRFEDGRAFVDCATPHASIGYRIDGSGGVLPSSSGVDSGFEREWALYTGPVALESGQRIEAKAIRYGYAESETTRARRR